jgi:hypothetical protein
MGMKRRAIDIIKANSCTGKRMKFKGFNKLSMPSVKDTGVVVNVNTTEPSTNKNNLAAKNIAA